jgi:hypothetical protein
MVSCDGSLELSATTATKLDDTFFHFRRELRLGQFLPVLGLHQRDVHVRADLERELDRHVPVVGAGGTVINEMVDARQLHFDGAGDRIRDDLGAGARIVAGDLHHRRGDVWKLRHRQHRHRHQSRHDADDRDDRGKDRLVDEKLRVHEAGPGLTPFG